MENALKKSGTAQHKQQGTAPGAASNDSKEKISLEDRLVKATSNRISKMTLNELEGLSYEGWMTVLDPEKLEDLIRKTVKDELRGMVS